MFMDFWLFLTETKGSTIKSRNGTFPSKCWKNGFEHNKLANFEIKLQWVPQTFFGESTWECVLLHECTRGNKTFKGYIYTYLVVGFGPQGAPKFYGRGRT